MLIEREKLAYAISAIWGMISLPVSEVIYDDVIEESGFLMRFFALLLALSPVWLIFGWRWLTNNKPISAKFWLTVTAAATLVAIGFAADFSLNELAWVPILALVTFLALVWAFERGDMLWWRRKSQSQGVSMPTPKNLQSQISPHVSIVDGQDGEEINYYEAINDFITSHGFYESLLELQGTDKEYCIASMKMHKAAYLSGQPEVVVGALTMDSVKIYEESRLRSILFLQSLEKKYLNYEEDDVDSYHPALDKAVSQAATFINARNMYVPLRGIGIQVNTASELLVYIASYLAMLDSGHNISAPGWNSFKASIEYRILDMLEVQPSLSDSFVTPEGTTFVHYTSEYFTEMTLMEDLVANCKTDSGEWQLQPLTSRILGNLGSDNPDHRYQLQVYLTDLSKFASKEIIPKVVRAFG
jgi:hypothetical protein